MAKKELEPRARELYVIQQLTLAEISRQLNISTRTLQNWKADGNWDIERSRIGSQESAMHTQIFELGEVIARKIKQDELAGTEVSPHRYAALNRILDIAEKSRDYENTVPKAKKNEKSPEERQQMAFAKMQQILGLDK